MKSLFPLLLLLFFASCSDELVLCTPSNCSTQNANCGSVDDGCGNILTCGDCQNFEMCSDQNQCIKGCTPKTCEELGKNCGTLSDGCGGELLCGDCKSPMTCGVDEPNLCGVKTNECIPTTCEKEGKNCGQIGDGCTGVLECGTCVSPEICGANKKTNICGQKPDNCIPTTCTKEAKNCGQIDDECGAKLDCGTCTQPQSCGGEGNANVCGCKPTTCEKEAKNCGQIDDGCGAKLDCGTCTQPESCGGSGEVNICGCTPTTCMTQNAMCGEITDGCGTTLQCGICKDPKICGGDGVANQCGGCAQCPAHPRALMIDQDGATDLTFTATHFYWISQFDDKIRRRRIDGAFNVGETIAANQHRPEMLHLDSQYAYWYSENSQELRRVLLGGGVVETLSNDNIKSFTGDQTHLYWITSTGKIKKANKNGTQESTLTTASHKSNNMIIDANDIFWTVTELGGQVLKMAKTGGIVTTLRSAAADEYPTALAMDNTTLYWVERDPSYGSLNSIYRIPKTGGSATTMLRYGHSRIGAINTTSTTTLYYTGNNDIQSLLKSANRGTPVKVFNPSASTIVLTDDFFYYSSAISNEIRRYPRCCL